MSYFKAVATDLDGTITSGDALSPVAIDALRQTRTAGTRALLVTGRILSELRTDFPELEQEFDTVVAENGAVLHGRHGTRDLAPAVAPELTAALTHRDVPLRVGRVLLACDASHDREVLEEIRRLELEYQIVRNRGAMMVLPAGVNKGTGLLEALAELGVSHHNTVGVGDAENDHNLLEVCELGVAVGNAVPALKRRADLVLEEDDGHGVATLLDDLRAGVAFPAMTERHRIAVGETRDARSVTLPANQGDVLITGATLSGKSLLTGLLVERLTGAGYTIVLIDPEGDHTELGRLRGVLAIQGGAAPPDPDLLGELVRHRYGSVVVDLSTRSPDERHNWLSRALDVLADLRRRVGLPHWVIIDEAQDLLDDPAIAAKWASLPHGGKLTASWRPSTLPSWVVDDADVVLLTIASHDDHGCVPETVARFCGAEVEQVLRLLDQHDAREVLLIRPGTEPHAEIFVPNARRTEHVRHRRKYRDRELPPGRGFFFDDGTSTEMRNLRDFCTRLEHADESDAETLTAHLEQHDFSRWVRDVIQDTRLSHAIHVVETGAMNGNYDLTTARRRIIESIRERYADERS